MKRYVPQFRHPGDELPSSDIDWFAVDAAGNIAAFCNGDAGVFPPHALHCLPIDLLAAGVRYDVSTVMSCESVSAESPLEEHLLSVWVETASDKLSIEVSCCPPADYSDGGVNLFYIDGLKGSALKSAFRAKRIIRAWCDKHMNYSEFGFFYYWCGPSRQGEPYERISSPVSPVTLESLPREVASRIRVAKFSDLNFSDTEAIFPGRYFDCAAP